MTFTITTNKSVAIDSPDHLCPVGCINDNFSSTGLIEEVISYFKGKKLSVLDLGCAGGQFAVDFIEKGHYGVGLEGSTNALLGSGEKNWNKYHNSNLFLCDITEEYQLYKDNEPTKFDFIHSEEVFEHIPEDKIDMMLKQIRKHLSDDGICCFGISLGHDIRDKNGNSVSYEDYVLSENKDDYFVLHQSVFSTEWWKNKLIQNGLQILSEGITNNNHQGYLFNHKVRPEAADNSCYFCCKKSKEIESINELINIFVLDPENPENNFNLALYYDNIGQTASALSYYLRCAERTDDDLLKYECLIRGSTCFDKQGTRNFTVKGMLQHAISVLPNRPESYYLLSRFYERDEKDGHWVDSYMIASIGEKLCDFNCPPLRTQVDYPGDYAILYQKAIASWWCGICEDSRDLFMNLLENYDIREDFRQNVIDNLSRMNVSVKPFSTYSKDKFNNLKVKFDGSENIKENYSEAYQDMFVLTMLNGKRNGTYLEIGAGNSFYGNNTALLEKDFEWTGVALDISEEFVNAHNNERKNPCLLKNALTTNYDLLLSGMDFPKNIDYLQIDCDPPEVSYKVLLNIPFETHKFAVITYEHDYYCDETKSFQEKSKRYLESHGYLRLINNVSPDGKRSYEDWWIHPELISKNLIFKMLCINENVKKAEDLFLLV